MSKRRKNFDELLIESLRNPREAIAYLNTPLRRA